MTVGLIQVLKNSRATSSAGLKKMTLIMSR